MVIHSDSNLGSLFGIAVILGVFATLLPAVACLASGKFRSAAKWLLFSAGGLAAYILAVVAYSLLSPQTTVRVGDSYCADILCFRVEEINAETRVSDTIYKVSVQVFSDAHRVATSARGTSIYLLDERGRRFPLINDISVAPFDSILQPQQSIKTTLTFSTAPDVRQLFLTADHASKLPFWVRLYFGSDFSYLHKQPLLRVL